MLARNFLDSGADGASARRVVALLKELQVFLVVRAAKLQFNDVVYFADVPAGLQVFWKRATDSVLPGAAQGRGRRPRELCNIRKPAVFGGVFVFLFDLALLSWDGQGFFHFLGGIGDL